MKKPRWKQVLDAGRRQLDEAAKAVGVEAGTDGLIDGLRQAHWDARQRADEAHARMMDAAGDRLNALTGDDEASARVAESVRRIQAQAQQGADAIVGAIDRIAGATADRVSAASGHDVSARAVKVGMAVTAAAMVGTADGLPDLAGDGLTETGVDGDFEGVESTVDADPGMPRADIDISQNGTIVSDGDAIIASAGGVTVKV